MSQYWVGYLIGFASCAAPQLILAVLVVFSALRSAAKEWGSLE